MNISPTSGNSAPIVPNSLISRGYEVSAQSATPSKADRASLAGPPHLIRGDGNQKIVGEISKSGSGKNLLESPPHPRCVCKLLFLNILR